MIQDTSSGHLNLESSRHSNSCWFLLLISQFVFFSFIFLTKLNPFIRQSPPRPWRLQEKTKTFQKCSKFDVCKKDECAEIARSTQGEKSGGLKVKVDVCAIFLRYFNPHRIHLFLDLPLQFFTVGIQFVRLTAELSPLLFSFRVKVPMFIH